MCVCQELLINIRIGHELWLLTVNVQGCLFFTVLETRLACMHDPHFVEIFERL
jgi:hypothetical protein